jgi:c-di-AMP phosphodiesterase-like protein
MEKLGGGGHMTIAGAQIEGVSVHQAIDRVKSVLDNMLAEGEI